MMHESCGHAMHSHLSDESLIKYSPFDPPRTKQEKSREVCRSPHYGTLKKVYR